MSDHRNDLAENLRRSAFAFRGYNVANLGRTPELLVHPIYGPIVESHLRQASIICSEGTHRAVDLVERVRAGRETTGIHEFAEDVALIGGVEMAQIQLLQEFHGISVANAQMAFGYSLGECSALIAAGVYDMANLLRVPVAMADDCAKLAEGVKLGVLLSRAPVLDFDLVRRLCMTISQEGKGVVDVSANLAPNSLLLMGQNRSLAEFETRLRDIYPLNVALRPHSNRFPPLHTPIMWQRNIPDRTALLLQTTPGGFTAPSVPVLSMVTGEASYGALNSRELLHRWVYQPQRLWENVYTVLAQGVETVIHVGPAPNLVPATFRRLSSSISNRLAERGLSGIGQRAISQLVRRPWLTRLLPSSAVLFRAPFVRQVILEDWLLANEPRR